MSIIPSNTAARKAQAVAYFEALNSVLPSGGVTPLTRLDNQCRTRSFNDMDSLATVISGARSGMLYIAANPRDPAADLGAAQGGASTVIDPRLVLADIDIGKDGQGDLRYAGDEDEAFHIVDIVADTLGTAPVTIVRTRGGLAALYCITDLTRDLAHAADRAVAAALADEGLCIDRGVLANIATLTRPAGSLHQKEGDDRPIVNELRRANPGAQTTAAALTSRIDEFITPSRPRRYHAHTSVDDIPMADLLDALGFTETCGGWTHPDGSSDTRDAAIFTGDDGLERVHIFSGSVAGTLLDDGPGSYTARWLLQCLLDLDTKSLDALSERLNAEGVEPFLDALYESAETAYAWVVAGGWPEDLSDDHITHLAARCVTAAQARALTLRTEERPHPRDDSDDPTPLPVIVGYAPTTTSEGGTVVTFPGTVDDTYTVPAPVVVGSGDTLTIATSLVDALRLQDASEVVLGRLTALVRQPGAAGNRTAEPQLSTLTLDPCDRDVRLALGPEWRRYAPRVRDTVLALRAAGARAVTLHDAPRDPETRVRCADQMAFSVAAAEEAISLGRFDSSTDPGLRALLGQRLRDRGHRYATDRRIWLRDDGTRLYPVDGAPVDEAMEIIDDVFSPDDRRAPSLNALRSSWLPSLKSDLDAGSLDEPTSARLARDEDHPYQACSPDGVLDLRTRETQPRPIGAPNLRRLGVHPRAFDPGEDLLTSTIAGRLMLDMCGGARDTASVLQEALSQPLVGLPSERIYFIVDAEGNAGKSTLLRGVGDVYADYGVQLSASAFAGQDGRFATAKLAGARFVGVSELDAYTRMSGQDIKRLATRDSIAAEHKGGKHFDFTPQHTLIVTTNHLPQLKNFDDATADRIVVIEVHPIPVEQRDSQLGTRLAQDAAGTAALLVAGAQRIIARLDQGVPDQGIVPLTATVAAATARYRRQEDHLSRWLAEHTTREVSGEATAVADVRDAFTEYMRDDEGLEDYSAPSKSRFIQNLGRCGITVGEVKPDNTTWRVSKRGVYAKGLVLQPPDAPQDLPGVIPLDDYRKARRATPPPMTATGETTEEEFDV